MNIGIIGSGKIGASVGKMWAAKGHKVLFSDILVDAAKAATGTVENVSHGNVRDAVIFGGVILLSIPYSSLSSVLKEITSANISDNRVIIDCTNPLSPDYRTLVTNPNTSAAEEINEYLKHLGNFKVVKALNTIASPVFESGDTSFGNDKATMFYCGDDSDAKKIVAELIADLGFEPVDAGPLVNARFLEPLAALIIQLAVSQEMGTNIALKLLKR